jgi:hypothetical protein
MGGYLQAYTLYSSVRPFGITAIVAGWDSELELPVDGQVGSGPSIGSGGKVSFENVLQPFEHCYAPLEMAQKLTIRSSIGRRQEVWWPRIVYDRA